MSRRNMHLPAGLFSVRTPEAAPGQRIGLMGGSFNPPHEAHLANSEVALRRLRLDQIWWLVTPGNPLKARANLPPLGERIEASRELARHPRIEVTGFEEALGTAYTDTTLAFLKQRFPSVHFIWIMGGDNLASFHRWRNWRRIAAAMPIAVFDRPGWRQKALASPAARALSRFRLPSEKAARLANLKAPAWTYLSNKLLPHSSTALRSASPANKSA